MQNWHTINTRENNAKLAQMQCKNQIASSEHMKLLIY
jgi:hypothetical protein